MIVRKAFVDDINRIVDLGHDEHLTYWSLNDYLNTIEDDNYGIYVAENGNQIIGLLVVYISIDFIEILQLVVDERHRRQGVARMLFEHIEAHYTNAELFLEVKETNHNAVSFYLNLNFEILSKRNNYYGDNENALILRKVI